MPKLPLADRIALRENLLALAKSKKKTFIQCQDKGSRTFYKCQLVSAKQHARGIRLVLHRLIDSCHWRVSFYQIDNITFLTKTKAHQKPHAWTPTPSSQVKSTPRTTTEFSRVTRAAHRRTIRSPDVTSSAVAVGSPPPVSSHTVAQARSFSPLSPFPFSELPLLKSPLQLSATRTPFNTPNNHNLLLTPAPGSPYGFNHTFSDLAKIASESLPRTNSIEAADRGAYVDLSNSPPTPTNPIQMVCKHDRIGKCPQCAALDLTQHTDI